MIKILKQQLKKVALAGAFAAASLGVSHAQETGAAGGSLGSYEQGQDSDPVRLNVVLHPFRTLTVNHSEINLVYRTLEDYQNGVQHRADGHLSVTNIGGGYQIFVKADSENLATSSGQTIDGSGVSITGFTGAQDADVHARRVNEAVASTGTELFRVSQNTTGIHHEFDVEYAAAGGNAYTGSVIDNKPTTYTVNIVYTILSE